MQVLEILKYALLALLYLFFARVLWAVWSEVRGPRAGSLAPRPAPASVATTAGDGADPTRPAPLRRRRPKGEIKRLTVIAPRERKGATFSMPRAEGAGEVTFGRAPTCTISVLDDAFVSNLHARFFHAEGVSWVEDLGSTNGSYLNGARFVGAEPIGKGDRVQFGSTVLEAN
jgi:hypothetical protein